MRSVEHVSVSVVGMCIILGVGSILILLDWTLIQQMRTSELAVDTSNVSRSFGSVPPPIIGRRRRQTGKKQGCCSYNEELWSRGRWVRGT